MASYPAGHTHAPLLTARPALLQIVERFTAHYVFALGLSRFFSCAHWILQVGAGPGLMRLASAASCQAMHITARSSDRRCQRCSHAGQRCFAVRARAACNSVHHVAGKQHVQHLMLPWWCTCCCPGGAL